MKNKNTDVATHREHTTVYRGSCTSRALKSMERIGIVIGILFGFILYAVLAKTLICGYYRFSSSHGFANRIIGRSFVITLLCGLGVIGVVGFYVSGLAMLSLISRASQSFSHFFYFGLYPFLLGWVCVVVLMGVYETLKASKSIATTE